MLYNDSEKLMQNFEEPSSKKVINDDAELHDLLQRLGNSQGLVDQIEFEPQHVITVEDVAEATGLSPKLVADELMAILNERREASISDVLRELEAPTYRVERPDVVRPDRLDAVFRTRSVQALMDRAKEKQLPHRPNVEEKTPYWVHVVGMSIVWLVVTVAAVALLRAVFRML